MLIKDINSGRLVGGKTLSGLCVGDVLPTEVFVVTLILRNKINSGTSSGTVTIKDAVLNVMINAGVFNYSDLSVSIPLIGYATGGASFSSSNTLVAAVDSHGVVTPIATGTTNITVSVPGLSTQVIAVGVTELSGTTAISFANYTSGSLAAACCSTVDASIAGKTPGSTTQLISNSTNFLRAAGVDLTFRATSGNGALISPHHVIQAQHLPSGAYSFTDTSGTVYSSSVSSATQIGSTDISIATLSTAISSAITPISVLPANFRSYLPQLNYGVACCYATQDAETFVGEWTSASGGFNYISRPPPGSSRLNWAQELRAGDSGNPCFLVVGTTPVLLHCWTSGGNGAGSGPPVSDHITAINAAMASESLTQINLSGYPTF